MEESQSFVNKLKSHPVVTFLVFVCAAIIGLASFTEAIGKISKESKCVPIYLGLDDGYQGNAKLNYSSEKKDWVKIGIARKTKSTGNHHCSRNCRGEPTRTNYQVNLSTNDYQESKLGDRKLMNPKLTCKTGPCGSWNQVISVNLSKNTKSATASFDVWSKPTTWVLTAEVFEYEVVSENNIEKMLKVSSLTPLEVKVPTDSVFAMLNGVMEDNRRFSFKVAEKDSSEILVFNSSFQNTNGTTYVYIINDNRCN